MKTRGEMQKERQYLREGMVRSYAEGGATEGVGSPGWVLCYHREAVRLGFENGNKVLYLVGIREGG